MTDGRPSRLVRSSWPPRGFGKPRAVVAVYTQSCRHPLSRSTLAAPGMESKWVWRRAQRRRTWLPSNHTPPTLVRESARYLPRLHYPAASWSTLAESASLTKLNIRAALVQEMLDLPGKQAYEIFDERIYQLHSNISGLRNLASLFDSGISKGANRGGSRRQIGNRCRRPEADHPRLQQCGEPGQRCFWAHAGRNPSVPHCTESK